jgi:hypothetical protein
MINILGFTSSFYWEVGLRNYCYFETRHGDRANLTCCRSASKVTYWYENKGQSVFYQLLVMYTLVYVTVRAGIILLQRIISKNYILGYA